MNRTASAVTGLAIAALLGASIAGCSSNKSSTTSSSASTKPSTSASSTVAAPADYTKLLIAAADITSPGDTFTVQEPTQNPGGNPGVAALFANQGDTREIGVTIAVLPDAATATGSLDTAATTIGSAVVGGTPQPIAVGSKGTVASGTSPDGAKAVTLLLFTEGKAFVTIEFDSGPDDPVPAEFVTDVGQKQAAAIKAGLPS